MLLPLLKRDTALYSCFPFIKMNIMSTVYKLIALLLFSLTGLVTYGQRTVSGKVIDAVTKEPLYGVSIHCTDKDCTCGCTTNALGEFTIVCKDCKHLNVSSIGFNSIIIAVEEASGIIS